MPSYDPKRPRPAAATTDDLAPIEAILDPGSAGTRPTDQAVEADDAAEVDPVEEPDETVEVDLRIDPGPDAPEPLLQAGGSEVPVAPAPEENTANRAVVAAALVVVAALVAVFLVVRRRRG